MRNESIMASFGEFFKQLDAWVDRWKHLRALTRDEEIVQQVDPDELQRARRKVEDVRAEVTMLVQQLMDVVRGRQNIPGEANLRVIAIVPRKKEPVGWRVTIVRDLTDPLAWIRWFCDRENRTSLDVTRTNLKEDARDMRAEGRGEAFVFAVTWCRSLHSVVPLIWDTLKRVFGAVLPFARLYNRMFPGK